MRYITNILYKLKIIITILFYFICNIKQLFNYLLLNYIILFLQKSFDFNEILVIIFFYPDSQKYLDINSINSRTTFKYELKARLIINMFLIQIPVQFLLYYGYMT